MKWLLSKTWPFIIAALVGGGAWFWSLPNIQVEYTQPDMSPGKVVTFSAKVTENMRKNLQGIPVKFRTKTGVIGTEKTDAEGVAIVTAIFESEGDYLVSASFLDSGGKPHFSSEVQVTVTGNFLTQAGAGINSFANANAIIIIIVVVIFASILIVFLVIMLSRERERADTWEMNAWNSHQHHNEFLANLLARALASLQRPPMTVNMQQRAYGGRGGQGGRGGNSNALARSDSSSWANSEGGDAWSQGGHGYGGPSSSNSDSQPFWIEPRQDEATRSLADGRHPALGSRQDDAFDASSTYAPEYAPWKSGD